MSKKFKPVVKTTYLNDSPLEATSNVVNFNTLGIYWKRSFLNKKYNATAKPFDVLLMFMFMLIQRYYNLEITSWNIKLLNA